MGQTKRFLEKIHDEQDALADAHALLRQKCEELYGDDIEKNQQLNKMINEMVSQADDIYIKVWREYESKVKNEDSELLEALSSVLNLTLEKVQEYKSELYAWKTTNNELWGDIGLWDKGVRQAELDIREHQHAPLSGFFFDVFASSTAKNRYKAVENALNAKLSTAKTNASTARKLYENHQKFRPEKPSL